MKKLKKVIFHITCTAGIVFLSFSSFSQTTFNAASHSVKINGMTFDYSIGEMTLVNTEKNINLIVTQGFLQPYSTGSDATENNPLSSLNSFNTTLKVYPNPTRDIIYIESIETMEGNINYQLIDVTGKVLISGQNDLLPGVNTFSMDLHNFAAGSYYLILSKPNTQGVIEKYSSRIQKTN